MLDARPTTPRASWEGLDAADPAHVALGAALLARDVYPGLDVTALLARFDELAAPLLGTGIGALAAEEQAARLAAHLYGNLRFRGNDADYHDPANSLLPDVLDRRLGIPITLALVYCEVARRVGVPARGIGFPGHFLVRIDRAEGKTPVIVDPFHRGRELDEPAILALLARALGPRATLEPELLSPAPPRAMLIRLLVNLKAAYLGRGQLARALLVLDRLAFLAPRETSFRRERGLLAGRLGMIEIAREDLARALELAAPGPEEAAVRAELAALKTPAGKLLS